ncbi:MAG: type IV secretion system DNA-binding domain-containing protein [Firmicutes bacterium]|nr:type IV secretion system DNA-binding domain-containing protein [Bacillota bacterium]
MYSLLRMNNVKAGNIFLVDISDKRWEKLFFNIIENEESISINEMQENLVKKIVSVKDSFYNIETRGYDLSSKKVKDNLKLIQNVFCGDGSVEFMGREWKSEAPVFMHVKDVNSFICKRSDIEKSTFFKIRIDTDDISLDYYSEIVNEYGVFILLFLDLVRDYIGILPGLCNDIYNGTINDTNIADSYKDTYAAFLVTLNLVKEVLHGRYKIDLDTELNINDETADSLLGKYFQKISFDENDIIDDILEHIKEVVKDTDEITEIFGRKIDKDTDLNKTIFIDIEKQEVLFKHNFFKNYIAPELNNNFKIKDVLKILADKGIIKTNKPSVIVDKSSSECKEKVCYECRRTILDGNGDTLFNGERFVVMELKYYRTYCELNKAKNNHERSKDQWEIIKDKHKIPRFKKYKELDKSKLINNHIFIAGASGSGKTYFLQKEVMNAVENGKSCVIIDTGNSFSSDELKQELKEIIGD